MPVALSDLDVCINLYRDGEKLFDLLKAVIREWLESPWPHEQERADYAQELFNESLKIYQQYLNDAHEQARSGFFYARRSQDPETNGRTLRLLGE